MDTNLAIPTGLDPAAVNLARAIRTKESNGQYDRVGDAGTSAGAYQWSNGDVPLPKGGIPKNFQEDAKQYGLDPNDFSPKNQDMVAYNRIKDLKDQGKNVLQIAALWNGGDENRYDPNYKTPSGLPSSGDVTINGKVVHYDVPAYVKAVNDYYQNLKAKTPGAAPAPADPSTQTSQDTQAPGTGDGIGTQIIKGLVSPVATMLARPIEAGAELLGASSDTVDKYANKLSDGLVAPVPQNAGDVEKDVGRGIETVALGLGPEASALAGAAFGLGGSLEQGNDLLSLKTALETAVGAAGGKLLETIGKPIFNVAGKVVGEITPQFLKDLAAKGPEAIKDFMAQHDILPEGVSNVINKTVDKVGKVVDVTKQAIKDELPFGKDQEMTSEDISKLAQDATVPVEKATEGMSAQERTQYFKAKTEIARGEAATERAANDAKLKTDAANIEKKINQAGSAVGEAGRAEADAQKAPARKLITDMAKQFGEKSEEALSKANLGGKFDAQDIGSQIDSKLEHKIDDPTFVQELKNDLGIKAPAPAVEGQPVPPPQKITAQEMVDKARALMATIPRAEKAGVTTLSANSYRTMQKYATIMDVLGDNGVDLSEANKFWKSWASLRNKINTQIKPFDLTGTQPAPFARTLVRANTTETNTGLNAISAQDARKFISDFQAAIEKSQGLKHGELNGTIDAETKAAIAKLTEAQKAKINIKEVAAQVDKNIKADLENNTTSVLNPKSLASQKFNATQIADAKAARAKRIGTIIKYTLGALGVTGIGATALHAVLPNPSN